MSKLLKSKLFFGVMLVAVLVLGGVAVNATPAAALDCSINSTLRVGSVGTEVSCLQTTLGILADGKFGPMTKASVMAWQASKGLVADGVFGPMSRAAWMMGTPVAGLPAGCSSTAGYSATTGVKCDSAVSGLPAGCTSTMGYSPTTGAKCDSSTGGGSSTGPLSGGAGDIIVSNTSSDVETEVTEGATEKVLAFRVEADGSDVEVTNVKVVFDNTGNTGSTRLNRYVDEVSILMDGREVGSVSADEFTKDGALYSKNITLSNAIVRMGSGSRATFHVAVSALSNIDSGDLTGDSWTVDTDGIRFADATGVVFTNTTNVNTSSLNFTDLATSGDVKVKVTKTSNSPVAQNVEVSDTGSTSDVNMLAFTVKAEATDVTFDGMKFNVTALGADANLITSELALYAGSTKLGDLSTVTDVDGGGATLNTIALFDEYTIEEGDTETFTVKAKINKIAAGGFAQGDSLLVSFDSFTGLEDSNGDAIAGGKVTGSAVGETQTFFSEGINISGFTSSSTPTTNQNGEIVSQTYAISYKVTAFGNTYYVPKTIVRTNTTAGTATQGLVFSVENSAGTAIHTGTAAASSLSSSASTVGSAYEIPDGETRTFNATIVVTKADDAAITGHGALSVPAFIRLQLETLRYDLASNLGTLQSYTIAPAQDYQTLDKQLQN